MKLNILVACEESQTVAKELRKLGHRGFSCDIVECSGGHPEWHISSDVTSIVNGNCHFKTQDGKSHQQIGEWDLIIAHPVCQYLTVTGNRWFNVDKYGEKAIQRMKNREEAIKFFMLFANAKCKHICIENPVGIMSTRWRKADQCIQPYYFGDPFEKKTCLWYKGLNPLIPTNIVEPEPRIRYKSGKTMPAWYAEAWHLPKHERSKVRSKTFIGIAKAMVNQFTDQIIKEMEEK